MIRTLSLCLLLLAELHSVIGHGYMVKPPGRVSAWRAGFNTPPNYNDNQMYCGGFTNQWKVEGGKCGICGDPWNGRRESEAPGGRYATGTIVAQYSEGQVIDIDIRVTTNHAGWFEFKLCENNNIYQDSDQSCFDKHLLEFTDGSTRVHVGPMGPAGKGIFSYQVKLPQGVTCEQCVIQWHYNGGQNWGCDADTGKCCEGCGPQETFWGCSDVAITGGGPNPPTIPPIPETTTVPDGPVTLEPTTTAGPKPGPGKKCHAISPYNNQPGMDDWCKENCRAGNCPPSMCACD